MANGIDASYNKGNQLQLHQKEDSSNAEMETEIYCAWGQADPLTCETDTDFLEKTDSDRLMVVVKKPTTSYHVLLKAFVIMFSLSLQ